MMKHKIQPRLQEVPSEIYEDDKSRMGIGVTEGCWIVVGRICQSVAGRGLVSGSRRNEVSKGG
jgi:hypothetical protein